MLKNYKLSVSLFDNPSIRLHTQTKATLVFKNLHTDCSYAASLLIGLVFNKFGISPAIEA